MPSSSKAEQCPRCGNDVIVARDNWGISALECECGITPEEWEAWEEYAELALSDATEKRFYFKTPLTNTPKFDIL